MTSNDLLLAADTPLDEARAALSGVDVQGVAGGGADAVVVEDAEAGAGGGIRRGGGPAGVP